MRRSSQTRQPLPDCERPSKGEGEKGGGELMGGEREGVEGRGGCIHEVVHSHLL